ncbi:aldehyde reductase [bacterium]|nr:aldehyde reductase [bacterium]
MNERVLVTGISGYIGQHCAVELLKQGYEVVGSVRSKNKAESTRIAIGKFAPVDKLIFTEADLLSDKGWDAAMMGCSYVLHVASPFVLTEPNNENDLITPAVEGTKRVLAAAKRANVKRVVLTSSTVSIMAGNGSGKFGPETWSNLNAKIGAYQKSKTLAEKAAWKSVEEGDMELTVINPGGVFGPPISGAVDGQNVKMLTDMIKGKLPLIPDVAMGMIDVRDVARLHVKAMTSHAAAGKRFIAASAEPVSMETVAQVLKEAGYSKVPTRRAPSALLKFMSLFDRQAKGMIPFLGQRASFDNRSTFELLDWQPTPIENSLREMAAAISQE